MLAAFALAVYACVLGGVRVRSGRSSSFSASRRPWAAGAGTGGRLSGHAAGHTGHAWTVGVGSLVSRGVRVVLAQEAVRLRRSSRRVERGSSPGRTSPSIGCLARMEVGAGFITVRCLLDGPTSAPARVACSRSSLLAARTVRTGPVDQPRAEYQAADQYGEQPGHTPDVGLGLVDPALVLHDGVDAAPDQAGRVLPGRVHRGGLP